MGPTFTVDSGVATDPDPDNATHGAPAMLTTPTGRPFIDVVETPAATAAAAAADDDDEPLDSS